MHPEPIKKGKFFRTLTQFIFCFENRKATESVMPPIMPLAKAIWLGGKGIHFIKIPILPKINIDKISLIFILFTT